MRCWAFNSEGLRCQEDTADHAVTKDPDLTNTGLLGVFEHRFTITWTDEEVLLPEPDRVDVRVATPEQLRADRSESERAPLALVIDGREASDTGTGVSSELQMWTPDPEDVADGITIDTEGKWCFTCLPHRCSAEAHLWVDPDDPDGTPMCRRHSCPTFLP